MDVVNAILKPVAEALMVPVKRHMGYFISCTKYVRDMGIKIRELNSTRVGVEEHMNRNTSNRSEVPAQVTRWLEEVRKINTTVENVPSNAISCLKLKMRHNLGRRASKIIEEIESVMREHSLIMWTDQPIPVGKVDPVEASTSTSLTDHPDNFHSREQTFMKALKALEPNHESHMIALCGMGGVGKTTMMKRLKEIAKEKKMFDYIVEAVMGQKADPINIQQAVADFLGVGLTEKTKPARADKLRDWFKANADGSKTKFLIILDDVWQLLDLNDIGLSHMPDQGVNFKILLTSRDRDVCTMMGVRANSILHVGLLTEPEAKTFFCQFLDISNDVDPELHKIREEIVTKCCRLPIAIKTMALTLRNKSKDAWKDALSRLTHHSIDNVVNEVFKVSYDNLQNEETESIFFLCGLFLEDFDIPTEELVRYGWGLRVFKEVYTIREARTRLNTCIERLIYTNLLMASDYIGCVKMHDLTLAFVLGMFSKVEHASIVGHGSSISMSRWSDVSNSCKRISLTCMGMSEFPRDLNFPNLSILKLMDGDESLKFCEDFYGEMEKLQVLSYDTMEYPFLPSLHHKCSTNLRVLHIDNCSLMTDCSSIGDMLSLEVLSFANSGIEWLPSAIGNLKKLRLLDLTECEDLHIDNDVLENLVSLEELYMITAKESQKAIQLTDGNCNELAKISEHLSALEFEFFENNAQPKNMSFQKIERFRISMGCYLNPDFCNTTNAFENTLELVTSKDELLVSRINELFDKTKLLHLQVDGMTNLEDVEVNASHPPQLSPFYNLKALVVTNCPELKYLFTLRVTKVLSNLESLEVQSCNNMEELIHLDRNEEETITFPKLNNLSLEGLGKLSGLCLNVCKINFPQLVELGLCGIPNITRIYPSNKLTTSCFIKEEFEIPKLEILKIEDLQDLKEIWDYEYRTSKEMKLREVKVKNCDSLVNLFPCNPMSFLCHLEELKVKRCGSVEVLFDIDLDCLSESREEGSNSSLTSIRLTFLSELQEVWRIKGENNTQTVIHGFQAVEEIRIESCKNFRNLVTPTTANFDLGALEDLGIYHCGESERNDDLVESSQEEEMAIQLTKETSQINDSIYNALFPTCHIHLYQLRELHLWNYKGVKVVFEIETLIRSGGELVITRDNKKQQPLLPYLETLNIYGMDTMTHLFKCNSNKILFLQRQPYESPLHNLTIMEMGKCKMIKYLFSPLIAQLLSNLINVKIYECDGIEEIVSIRDDDDDDTNKTTSTNTHTTISLFPRLQLLQMKYLPNLKCIGGDGVCANIEISFDNTSTTTTFIDESKFPQVGGVSWTFCHQHLESIKIVSCDALSSLIPSYALGSMQKLEVLEIWQCNGMNEVFDTQGINNSVCRSTNINIDEENGDTPTIPRLNNVMKLKLPNLQVFHIYDCGLLEHIFPFSALESLRQLKQLKIEGCKSMKVIVKEEEEDDDDGDQQTTTTNNAPSKKVVVFPCLKSIELDNLPELVGFFLGMNIEFQWPLLDDVRIKDCPQMIAFTRGRSTAPELKYIHSSLGKHSLECGLNSPVTTTPHQTSFPSVDSTSFSPASSQGIHWSFHNLTELYVHNNLSIKEIIPSNEFLHLQYLEKIHLHNCYEVVEVFETLEAGTKSSTAGFDESQTTTIVKLPNLKEVKFNYLPRLSHVWNNNRWTVFELPNLTRVSIVECDSLKYGFTRSMVGSLLQLQKLFISNCDKIKEVIVKDTDVAVEEEEEESNDKMNEIITLPRLQSIELVGLKVLKGFCLLEEEVLFPSLNTLEIMRCPAIKIFTKGKAGTPELKSIQTSSGFLVNVAGEDINSSIKTNQETPLLENLDSTSLCPAASSSQRMHFPFHNLIKLQVADVASIEHIIPSNELLHLKNLEKIHVQFCDEVVEVFETLEAETNSSTTATTLVTLPNLKDVFLYFLPRLSHVWKNNRWTIYEFSNLTTLSIWKCDSLKHVFTRSMVGSLLQLQELCIRDCNNIEEVIVKDADVAVVEEEEESHGKSNEIITLPCLKSIVLVELEVFKGFCLLEEEVLFPSLNTLETKACPAMTFFTMGKAATPELKSIKTSYDLVDVAGEDINSFIKMNQEEFE